MKRLHVLNSVHKSKRVLAEPRRERFTLAEDTPSESIRFTAAGVLHLVHSLSEDIVDVELRQPYPGQVIVRLTVKPSCFDREALRYRVIEALIAEKPVGVSLTVRVNP